MTAGRSGPRLALRMTALLGLVAFAAPLRAQILTGVVRDGESGEPLAVAGVVQILEDGSLIRSETDESGRFELRLGGGAPFDLLIERLGYAARRITLDRLADATQGTEFLLWRDPIVLPGVNANVRQDTLWWSTMLVTEAGLRHVRRGGECYYLTLDGVVIRDPRLFDPKLAANYAPAQALVPRVPALALQTQKVIRSERLRREAWPCGTIYVIHAEANDRRYRALRSRARGGGPQELTFERGIPEPDAPLFTLAPIRRVDVPDGTPIDLRLQTGPDGRLGIAVPGRPALRLFTRDGSPERDLDLARAAGFRGLTAFGWLGDTLWAADADAGRIARFPPHVMDPVIREFAGTAAAARPGPPELASLELPRPLADGRWLVNHALPDATWPRRPGDPPTTRHLISLDSAWAQSDVLGVLRPAPEPLVLGVTDLIQPLSDHVVYEVSPDGRHITIVRRAIDMAVFWSVYSVIRVDTRGNTIFHVDRIAPLVRVRDSAVESLMEDLVEHPALLREFPSAAARRTLVRGGLFRPTVYYAPISDVVVGQDGTTWLRWPDARRRSVRWDVLDAGGRPLRTLNLDRRLRILDADADGVWALAPGKDGALTLTRFTLEAAQ
jgi:hypothetical protein